MLVSAQRRVLQSCYPNPKEHDRVEGCPWAQLGYWAAPRWCVRPSRRIALTLLLIVFLLAPSGPMLSFLLGRDSSRCAVHCCKRSDVCCCGKPGHHAHRDGPAWAAASKCPDGCGQLPARQRSLVASLGPARFETAPVIISSQARRTADPCSPTSAVAFALFERPPPVPA
jgi:hypothetical protein